jgi:hypothetical protein
MPRFSGASDTPAEVERLILEGYRRMSPAERLERVCALNRSLDVLALAGIRARHPGLSEVDARMRLGVQRYGAELIKRAYGWPPSDAR